MYTKRKRVKSIKKPQKPLPIVVVPDKSYLDDTGNVIPIDVICVADPTMYMRMQAVLAAWGKAQIGIPGKRGVIEE